MRNIFSNIVTLILVCTLSTINISGAADALGSEHFVEHRDIPEYNTGWNYTGGKITIATLNSTRTYTAQSIYHSDINIL